MIEAKNFSKYIEHTLLKPDASQEEIQKLLDEAVKYNFLAVCVNPFYVKFSKDYLKNSDVMVGCTVGFPLGANVADTKAFEAKRAVDDGADEVDMVMNIGALKSKNYSTVEKDIAAVVNAAKNKKVKVILETDLLTKEEIIKACKISVMAGANFVKTSTGFLKNGVGATAENVKLMSETVSPYGLQVKASGGIRNRDAAISLIEAGATRLGTSSGISIVEGV